MTQRPNPKVVPPKRCSASRAPSSTPISDVTQRYEWLRLVALDRTISANAVRVAVLLSLHYLNRKTMLICPSHDTIGAELGLGSSTVRRATKDLEGAGYVNSFKAFGGSNRYILHLPIRSELSGLENAENDDLNPLDSERIERSESSELARSDAGTGLDHAEVSSIRSKLSAQSAQNRAPNHEKTSMGGAPIERPPDEIENAYRVARQGGDQDSGAHAERRTDIAEDHLPEQAIFASRNPATEPTQDSAAAWPPDPDEQDMAGEDELGEDLTEAEKEKLRREFEEHLEAYDDEDWR